MEMLGFRFLFLQFVDFCGNVNLGSGSILLEDGWKQQPKDEHHKCHGHSQRSTNESYKEETSQRK